MFDLDPIRQFLIVFGISIVRISAACSIAPFLSSGLLQNRLRNSVIFSWGLIVYPIVAPSMSAGLPSGVAMLGLIAKEIVIGLLIGYIASQMFWIALSIGYAIDNQRGASMASSMDPMTGEQTSPLGEFLQQTIVVLFYTGGGMLLFLNGVFESYLLWPVDSFYPTLQDAFPGFFLEMGDDLMRLTVILAAPVMVTVFVTEFGLGLVNRFAPQLNVFFLAMPVKSLVALLVLVLYLPFLLTHLQSEFLRGQVLNEFFQNVME